MQTAAETNSRAGWRILMPHHAPFSLVTVAILALVAWRVYMRLRRSIGRQRFVPARPG